MPGTRDPVCGWSSGHWYFQTTQQSAGVCARARVCTFNSVFQIEDAEGVVTPVTQGHTRSAWHHRDSDLGHSFLRPVCFSQLGASWLACGPPSPFFPAPPPPIFSRSQDWCPCLVSCPSIPGAVSGAGRWLLETQRFRQGTDTSVLLENGRATFNHAFHPKPGVLPARRGSGPLVGP